MITIASGRHRFCDGLTRRSLLKIGGLAMGGLTLPDLLRAEAIGGTGSASGTRGGSHKSLIMIFLSGGPPHQDMVDLKPTASPWANLLTALGRSLMAS